MPDSIKVKNGGAVASECAETSAAAISILNRGGNAVDAAIAAAAVQGVTRPFSGGIGGDGFMHIYLAQEKKFIIIDHRSLSPAAFNDRSFVNPATGDVYPGHMRASSTMATAVPGVVKAWEEALVQYGTMSFEEVLERAIDIAENGFIVDENLRREIKENEHRFKQFSSTKMIYFNQDGNVPAVGERLKNPDLGKSYRLIADQKSKAFYEGDISQAIIDTVQHPPVETYEKEESRSEEVIAGMMTAEDLRNYSTVTREPVKTDYRGYSVYAPPPVSSGGITIGQILNIVEGFDLENSSRTTALHYFIEACRYAYADRDAYIGDPSIQQVPMEGLLSKAYANERRKEITSNETESSAVIAGDPWAFEAERATRDLRTYNEEKGTPYSSTIHLSVSDEDGNIVSYTSTIVSIGGSGVVVPGYGFLLNNALAGMTATKDASDPNYPKPKIRPLSSMSPTIVMRDEQPYLVLGSPGSATIITTIAQIIISCIDFNMSLSEAVAAPRFSQVNDENGSTAYERILADDYKDENGGCLLEQLKQMGHRLTPNEQVQGIGCVNGIAFRRDNRACAVAEPIRRGGGSAAVQYPIKESVGPYLAE